MTQKYSPANQFVSANAIGQNIMAQGKPAMENESRFSAAINKMNR